MKITLNRINDDFLFECSNSAGNSILLDNTSQPNPKGVSPMETMLMAVAGCSGIDMVSILKKQRQNLTSFKAEVEGTRVPIDDAKPFKSISVKFLLEGEIDEKKALKAAQLSFEKYCSVSKTLEPNVSIDYQVYLNGLLLS
ncbi:disulfide bond formation regulator [Riemerella anatipestifer]|uniref:OsmC family protein n=1 Tax=Riemerella anatipestifer TaxID=34085 RepID=A0AAP6HF88_RIEAN|nr:OsmC family protein [Riemerella anatipestifer]MBT0549397.1 OsmC family protein [Riemerella anatipestifer]MBT0555958.1 OsmC family protein [Riemerella anatipestifer]MBT0560160.1 OsmC family protein [Riemerella anatipestifer]MCD5968669.1 OsmC family protein [Riemerella anatipestifer]MCO4304606.1 OsmC family protein [Riemerella anatipestifer]